MLGLELIISHDVLCNSNLHDCRTYRGLVLICLS